MKNVKSKFLMSAAVAGCLLASTAIFAADFNACPFPGDVKLVQSKINNDWRYTGQSTTGFTFTQVLYPYSTKPNSSAGNLETVYILPAPDSMTHSQVACWYSGMLGHGALWLQDVTTPVKPLDSTQWKKANGMLVCKSSNPNKCSFQS